MSSMLITRCADHGSVEDEHLNCATYRILNEVEAERRRQFAIYGGNLENASGTGPDVRWAAPILGRANFPADLLEKLFRGSYEETQGHVTWLQLVLEEVAEAFMEDNPAKLATELVQVAALCVAWAEKLRYDPQSAVYRPTVAEALQGGER